MKDLNQEQREAFFRDWHEENPKPSAEDVIKLLQQVGRPPDVTLPEFDPSRIRCACNKDVPCGDALVVSTGQMTAVEPVCEPCRVDYDGMARLVCISCRAVIGWLKPQKDKHGFNILPNNYYHVANCRVCKKDLQKADIIEMMVYYDELGIPYDKGSVT